ncbi:MAG: four helix bundle protein [Lentisphaerota bacterium]
MARFEKFEDMVVWQKARVLTRRVYEISNAPSFARDFGLCDQIRRAVVSIMSNMAEGFERDGDKEFMQFLALAKGSCGEVRSQLYIASDLGYVSSGDAKMLCGMAVEISKMISGLMAYLRKSEITGRKYRQLET